MADRCFCGCNRKVRFSRRPANRLGVQVCDVLGELELIAWETDNQNFYLLVEIGRRWRAVLLAAVHRVIHARQLDQAETLRWLAFATAIRDSWPVPQELSA